MSETLKAMLVRHEGVRSKVYFDSVGISTIGVGRNLEGKGLSPDEVDLLLSNDIDQCVNDLTYKYLWFNDLNRIRQNAMIDMRFNLGSAGFAGFKNMIAAMSVRNYEQAAHEMMESRWSIQVGKRSNELAEMIRTGEPLEFT